MPQTQPTARTAALALLNGVLGEGRLLSELLPGLPALTRLQPADRAAAQRLATETLRGLERADRLLQHHLKKYPPLFVRNVLRLGTVEQCRGPVDDLGRKRAGKGAGLAHFGLEETGGAFGIVGVGRAALAGETGGFAGLARGVEYRLDIAARKIGVAVDDGAPWVERAFSQRHTCKLSEKCNENQNVPHRVLPCARDHADTKSAVAQRALTEISRQSRRR